MRRNALTLIELLVVLAIIGLLIALLLPAVQAARESSRATKCSSNLRQIAMALHQYEDAHGVLPACSYNNYSFLVPLLPHLEQKKLFDQIDFSVNGMDYVGPLRSTRVQIFECPSDASSASAGDGTALARSNYHGNSGCGAQKYGYNGLFAYGDHPLGSMTHLPLAAITDGLSQTAMVAELAAEDGSTDPRRCIWLVHGDEGGDELSVFCPTCRAAPLSGPKVSMLRGFPWLTTGPYPMLYNHVLGPNEPSCRWNRRPKHSIWTASSMHRGSVHVAMADGSAHPVSEGIAIDLWHKFGSRNGVP